MRKNVIFLLAVVTTAIAYWEFCTVGIPYVEGDFGLMSFYLPAAIVILMTTIMLFLRFSAKDVVWSLIAGSVTVISSYVWSRLAIVANNWLATQPVSDLNLLLALLLMVLYLLAIPAFALNIYFYSIKDALTKMYN